MQKKMNNADGAKALTLVEMVIAMAVMAVVFTAMVPVLAGVRNHWDTWQANGEIVQNARVLADHLHRTLASAARITDVSPPWQDHGFVEFTVRDGTVCRYDLGPNGYVRFGPTGEAGELAGPVRRFCLACYDGEDFTTATVEASSIRFVTVETTFANPARLGRDKTFATRVYIRPGSFGQETPDTFEPGVALRDSVAWGGKNICIDSYRSSQGPYDSAQPGAEAVVSVNATTSQAITLWSSAIIRGDAYVGPGGDPQSGIATWGLSEITGRRASLSSPVDIPVLSAPTGRPFSGGCDGPIELTGQQSRTIDSDRYVESVSLSGHSVLVIDGHVTLLVKGALRANSHAELRILPDSSATIYVGDSVEISAHSRLNSAGDPSQLRINLIGISKSFQMNTNAVVHAVLQNPQGSVGIWSQAEFLGKIKAARLEGGGRIHVDLDSDF